MEEPVTPVEPSRDAARGPSEGTSRSARRLGRRMAAVGAVVLVALAVAVVLLTGNTRERDERNHRIETWQQDLQTWEDRQSAALTPGEGPELSTLIDGLATDHVEITAAGIEQTPEALDAINAACTALNAFADAVGDAPEPPAPPRQLDTAHPDAADPLHRFDRDRAALATYRQAIAEPHAALRQLCGTYPALVAVHADADAAQSSLAPMLTRCDDAGCLPAQGTDPVALGAQVTAATIGPSERTADVLTAQCYLPELSPVCAADAAQAAAMVPLQTAWRDALVSGDDSAARTAVSTIQAQSAAGEEAFRQAAGQVLPNADRLAIAQLTIDLVTEREEAFAAAQQSFVDDLG